MSSDNQCHLPCVIAGLIPSKWTRPIAKNLRPRFHVAHDSYPGIGVPVVPCGRRVVISGILAGGTPGFRNALMTFLHPSRAPCSCVFSGFGVVSRHARLSCQHISCCNSHRADLSIEMMWVFPGFCLGSCFALLLFWFVLLWFLFVLWVVLRVVTIAYGQYLDCVWVHALFWYSQRGDDARCCTIRSTDTNTVLRPGESREGDGRKKIPFCWIRFWYSRTLLFVLSCSQLLLGPRLRYCSFSGPSLFVLLRCVVLSSLPLVIRCGFLVQSLPLVPSPGVR